MRKMPEELEPKVWMRCDIIAAQGEHMKRFANTRPEAMILFQKYSLLFSIDFDVR